jgi:hypothetical protein
LIFLFISRLEEISFLNMPVVPFVKAIVGMIFFIYCYASARLFDPVIEISDSLGLFPLLAAGIHFSQLHKETKRPWVARLRKMLWRIRRNERVSQ